MKTSKHFLTIDRNEICYLQWIIDSYDGIASMRTIDSTKGDVEISIAPGCEEEVFSLIRHLEGEGMIHTNKERF